MPSLCAPFEFYGANEKKAPGGEASALDASILSQRTNQARRGSRRRSRSRKTLDPSDNCHAASSAKNSDEKQVAVIQRKAKTKTREQGKSNQLP
jgi:hypothetical protein